jgi:uncharacterized protein YkwD
MRVVVTSTALFLALVCAALAAPAPAESVSVHDARRLEQAVLKRINAVRANHGLPRLGVNERLTKAATSHTSVMATHGYCDHDWWDGTPLSTWIRWFWPGPGYDSWGAAENLYAHSRAPGARRVVRWWMNSPSHRANILGRWRFIGGSAVRVRNPTGTFRRYSAVTMVAVEFGRRS